MAKRLLDPQVRGIPGRATCLALLCLLAGCSRQSVTTRMVVNTGEEATDAQVAETARVLLARFDDWLPSIRSKVTAHIDGRRVHFEFLGESPSPADLVYLATTQGVFRIASSDAPGIIWISDLDFVNAGCGMEDDQPYLALQLTPTAGNKMLELTRRHLGKAAVATLDGKVLSRAVIRGVFGERFRTTISADDHIRLTCGILKTGRLPVPIAGYEFESTREEVNAHPGNG